MQIQGSEEQYAVLAGLHLGSIFNGVITHDEEGKTVIKDVLSGRVFPEDMCRCLSKPFTIEKMPKVKMRLGCDDEYEKEDEEVKPQRIERLKFKLSSGEEEPVKISKRSPAGSTQFDWLKEFKPGEERFFKSMTWTKFCSLRSQASEMGTKLGWKFSCRVTSNGFKVIRTK